VPAVALSVCYCSHWQTFMGLGARSPPVHTHSWAENIIEMLLWPGLCPVTAGGPYITPQTSTV